MIVQGDEINTVPVFLPSEGSRCSLGPPVVLEYGRRGEDSHGVEAGTRRVVEHR